MANLIIVNKNIPQDRDTKDFNRHLNQKSIDDLSTGHCKHKT